MANTMDESDEAKNAQTPPLWRIYQLCKANLVALGLVVLSFTMVVVVTIHVDQSNRSKRRKDFCSGIHYAMEGPLVDAFSQALGADPHGPEANQARMTLKDGLGPNCTGPVGGIPTVTTVP